MVSVAWRNSDGLLARASSFFVDMMKFEPFTITLHDDGETLEQAHVHPEFTMFTTSVNGVKEPARVIDTKYFLMIADAVNSAMAANV